MSNEQDTFIEYNIPDGAEVKNTKKASDQNLLITSWDAVVQKCFDDAKLNIEDSETLHIIHVIFSVFANDLQKISTINTNNLEKLNDAHRDKLEQVMATAVENMNDELRLCLKGLIKQIDKLGVEASVNRLNEAQQDYSQYIKATRSVKLTLWILGFINLFLTSVTVAGVSTASYLLQ